MAREGQPGRLREASTTPGYPRDVRPDGADLIGSLRIPIIYNDINPKRISELQNRIMHLRPNRVISTVPAPALCVNNHSFLGHTIFADGSTQANGLAENSVDRRRYPGKQGTGYQTYSATGLRRAGAKAPKSAVARTKASLYGRREAGSHPRRTLRSGAKSVLVHEVYPAVAKALEPSPDLIRGTERVTGETYLGEGGRTRRGGFPNKPVVGLDIDGTLGDYHGHFSVRGEVLGRPFPHPQKINQGSGWEFGVSSSTSTGIARVPAGASSALAGLPVRERANQEHTRGRSRTGMVPPVRTSG